jgi:hypothetical protein
MAWIDDYRNKRRSADEAVSLIKSGDRVFTAAMQQRRAHSYGVDRASLN